MRSPTKQTLDGDPPDSRTMSYLCTCNDQTQTTQNSDTDCQNFCNANRRGGEVTSKIHLGRVLLVIFGIILGAVILSALLWFVFIAGIVALYRLLTGAKSAPAAPKMDSKSLGTIASPKPSAPLSVPPSGLAGGARGRLYW